MQDILDEEQVAELDHIDKRFIGLRCKCGELIYFKMPCYCRGCSDPKLFWKTEKESIALQKMSLGHLSNTIRILGARAEKYPTGEARKEIEIAMDLIYEEIGSRDLEIKQTSGILSALKRSLATDV